MKRFNEFTKDLAEATFKPGNLKLASGETVKISREDVKALSDMLKSVDKKNQAAMEKDMLKDKKSFEEILKFAKEAL